MSVGITIILASTSGSSSAESPITERGRTSSTKLERVFFKSVLTDNTDHIELTHIKIYKMIDIYIYTIFLVSLSFF